MTTGYNTECILGSSWLLQNKSAWFTSSAVFDFGTSCDNVDDCLH